MSYLKKCLQVKERELTEYLRQASETSREHLDGSLKVKKKKNSVEYYWMKNGKRDNGEYLNKTKQDIAKQLAQKGYNRQVRAQAELQLKTIRALLAVYRPNEIAAIYDRMIPERQRLITPVIEPTDLFVAHWLEAHPGQQNPYPIQAEILTEQGELVRSKSEKIIADKLYAMGIPYRYEVRLNLPGAGVIYPDFTILNKRTRKEWIWEHEGRMDDPEYSSRAALRLEDYEKNGYWPGQQLIFTCETKDHSLNMRIMNEIIERYLL